MKIAFVSLMSVVAWGGSEELWYKTALLALAEGYSVESLTHNWNPTPNKIAELSQKGVDTKFFYDSDRSLLSRTAVKLKLKKDRADVLPALDADIYIITNGSTWDFVRYRRITDEIIKLGKPYILISQHAFEFGDVITDCQRQYALDVIAKAARFYFVSERNLKSSERQIAHRIENAAVISNPLNIREKLVQPFPESSQLLMACVARIECGVKGQDILLEALSEKRWASRDFQLKFYGTGPHMAHLHHLVSLYELQDKVTLEGHVSDIDEIWKHNQVLVLPSLSEGTPLALVEAMLSGRAALATDVGDINKYVQNNDTGFLIDTCSVKCLSAGLEELWNKKDSLKALGENAFRHASQITDFQPDVTLLNFIESLRIQP